MINGPLSFNNFTQQEQDNFVDLINKSVPEQRSIIATMDPHTKARYRLFVETHDFYVSELERVQAEKAELEKQFDREINKLSSQMTVELSYMKRPPQKSGTRSAQKTQKRGKQGCSII